MTSFKQKLKSKLGEFASILQVGYFLYNTEVIYQLRNIKVIAWSTLFFGLLLHKNKMAYKTDGNMPVPSDFALRKMKKKD